MVFQFKRLKSYQGQGGTLATINDDLMNNWIHAKIGENQIDNHNYWIGLVAKTKVYIIYILIHFL